eukprot:FR743967.1.p2 GENE.FR743967.1~~FR743967.1.p2  ORF type:complete len:103 (-),score=3.27 FR743967.1:454-762(-)
MAKIPPSAQLTLPKGNKSGSSPAVAAALELGDPLGSGPFGCHSLRPHLYYFIFINFLDWCDLNHPKICAKTRDQDGPAGVPASSFAYLPWEAVMQLSLERSL